MKATLCSFSEMFKLGTVKKIIIPKLQRDYAQGRKTPVAKRVRDKFLDALYDAVTVAPIELDFVYGDIDGGVLSPLDGQQRLTTLFLLYWYAAKRGNIDRSRYEFLKNFGYDTRYSAREFCSKLVDFAPTFDSKPSDEIVDSEWFPLDYLNDPTVSAMLEMLDAIDEKFKGVDDLFDTLDDGAIKFYFLPVSDMGLTDELYIKMNSRGKPLTVFEHFKAEFEREIKSIDETIADRVIRKFDSEWTDLLWKYRNVDDDRTDNDNIDDAFLRYFRFICDIICYGNGHSDDENRTTFERDNDEFNLIEKYFSHTDPEAKANVLTLENYFDMFCGLGEDTQSFFARFMSAEHEPKKIKYADKLDLFEECIFGYADVSETSVDKKRLLPLGKAARLFAFTVYIDQRHARGISESDFARRLRIINNLIINSQNEVADTPKSDNRNRMPKILKLIREIVTGKALSACDNTRGFNPTQFAEEVEKQQWLADKNNEQRSEELFALEDHPLLDGQIGVVGLDDPERFARFGSLFSCDFDAVGCAMLAVGDYSQNYNSKVKLGARNVEAWKSLLHVSKNFTGFDSRTRPVLCKLLDMAENFTDAFLRDVAGAYLKECEKTCLFDWRYYFIKYLEFRPDRYGKYDWSGGDYEFVALWSNTNLSDRAYCPYLKAIGLGRLSNDDPHNIRLILDDRYVVSQYNGFGIISSSDGTKRFLPVKQMNGVDAEDRILLARAWIASL